MNAQSIAQSTYELSFGFFAEWLKRWMLKLTKKTVTSVEQPSIKHLDYEGFKRLVEVEISAPVVFSQDPMGFYAHGSNFSIEWDDGVMRCCLDYEEVSFRKLIAEVA